MRRKGKHLSYNDRLVIESMYNNKYRAKAIASALNCHISTIYNELKRGMYTRLNSDYTTSVVYSADIAQQKHDFLSSAKGRPIKLSNNFCLAKHIENKIINEKYSPEAVILELKQENGEQPFCVQTLYNYIYSGVFYALAPKHLPEFKKKEKKRSIKRAKRVSFGESIEHRIAEIDERLTVGHWEMDTVRGLRNGKNESLLVLTERKTNFEIIKKLKDLKTETVFKTLKRIINNTYFNTITVDNGTEFSNPKLLESLGVKLYYCHPYSSYERGQNEKQNRMIRRWLPKGNSFRNVTQKHCNDIQHWLNNYPRKLYNGMTSKQMYIIELTKSNLPIPDFVYV